MVFVYGEVDIEGLNKDAGRAGTEGGSEENAGTIDDIAAVVVGGSDDDDEAEPARSHGFGGDAIRCRGKFKTEFTLLTRLCTPDAPQRRDDN